jgi:hypothetical protein
VFDLAFWIGLLFFKLVKAKKHQKSMQKVIKTRKTVVLIFVFGRDRFQFF